MRLLTTLMLTIAVVPGFAASEQATDESGGLCVRNASERSYVFAVEAPGADRQVQRLAPGDRLCVNGEASDQMGMVSVFEGYDVLEGCSRLVPVGRTEDMIRYVDFDRCFWGSNSPSSAEN